MYHYKEISQPEDDITEASGIQDSAIMSLIKTLQDDEATSQPKIS